MANEQDWTIEFYQTETGASPVEEFLSELDTKTQVRFAWSIEQLRIQNVRAREPLVKPIEGKLWELRRASGGNIYRLMYFFLWVAVSYLCMVFKRKPRKRHDEKLK